ncbi:signal peptidase I [Enterococcus saccharolyticus]|nr:signal peptidase I [Enterococcus saccharolyticus]
MAGALALMIRGFLLIPVPVEGNSMETTLQQGDMVVVEKISEIKRFDVIVFQLSDGTTYIKRVIGLPGESVSYANDQLYINGKKVAEPFLEKNLEENDEPIPFTYDFTFEELMGVEKLGKDSYFVIGDNRRLSKDSRSFGAISEENILGKARFVYYPFAHMKFI